MTLLVLVLLAAQAAGAASKPDLSGQWVINAAESDFGLIPPPRCRGLTLRYTTDGKPITYTANDAKQTARMTWSGNILVIQRSSDDGITMRIEAALSADGRKLTRDFSVDSPQGSTSWLYVYDRAK